MAAAATGARRGKSRAESRINYDRAVRASLSAKLHEAEQRMVDNILKVYDTDFSGGLSKTELLPLLNAYCREVFDREFPATAQHADFLFALCDHKTGNKNDIIDRNEVIAVVEAWSSFLKKQRIVSQFMERARSGEEPLLWQPELQVVLDEMACGQPVPEAVTEWVLEQGDLNMDGALDEMELARALGAFGLWQGKKMSLWSPDRLLAGIAIDSVPASQRKSKICVLL